MAINILPRGMSSGEALATGLGSGISKGLQALAQQKLGQLAQRQQQDKTQKGLDLLQSGQPEAVAQGLAMLPAGLQPEALKNLRMGSQQANLMQYLEGILGGEQAPGGTGTTATDHPTFGAPALSEKATLDLANIAIENKKQAEKGEEKRWNYNKEFLKEVSNKTTSAAKSLSKYAAQRALVRRGNLPNPTFYNITKKLGGETFAELFNPEAEQYGKVVQDFVRNIKDVFGARITEKQIEEFLKSLPTLANTDEGKLRILDFLELNARAEMARGSAIEKIKKEHGGIPPYDLRSLVAKESENIYENLGNQLVELINSPERYTQGASVEQSDLSNLIDGTVVSYNGKRYIMKNGKPVAL